MYDTLDMHVHIVNEWFNEFLVDSCVCVSLMQFTNDIEDIASFVFYYDACEPKRINQWHGFVFCR